MKKISCDNCIHSFYEPDNENLLCRRFPPVVIKDELYAIFPTVDKTDLCGEFTPVKD